MSAILADFPPELLSCITKRITPLEVGRLWFSGDSTLLGKLRNGGVTHLDFDLGYEPHDLPIMASYFLELRHLAVTPPEASHAVPMPSSTFHRIPSKVTSIQINRIDLRSLLYYAPHVWGQLTSLIIDNTGPEDVQYIAKLPTSLTRLECISYLASIEPQPLLDAVPASVTALIMPRLESSGEELSDFSKFTELQELDFDSIDGISISAVVALPHLRALSLPSSWDSSSALTLELVTQLSRHLVELMITITEISMSIIAALPQNLKVLILSADCKSSESPMLTFDEAMVQALPRNLTNLTIVKDIAFHYPDCHYLPPSLTHATFKHLRPCSSPQDPSKPLPKSITLLHVGSAVLDLNLILLPSKLTYLTATDVILAPPPNSGLPPSLTTLHLTKGQSLEERVKVLSFIPHASSSTPSITTLTSQDAANLSAQTKPPSWLPQGLKTLWMSASPFPSLQLASSSLTSIELLQDYASATPIEPGWSRHLPPTLTHLEIHVPNNTFLDSTWIDHLCTPQLRSFVLIVQERETVPVPDQWDVNKLLMALPSAHLQRLSVICDQYIAFDRISLSHFRRVGSLLLYGRRLQKHPKNLFDRLPPNLRILMIRGQINQETFKKATSSNAHPYIYAGTDEDYMDLANGKFEKECQRRRIRVTINNF